MPKKKVPPKRVIPFKKRTRKPPKTAFKPGRAKTGGRKKGTPNKLTVDVKEFMSAAINDPEIQEAMKAKMMIGDGALFMKMVEQTLGKPKEELKLETPDMAALITLALKQ